MSNSRHTGKDISLFSWNTMNISPWGMMNDHTTVEEKWLVQ